jgi:hypothetical protein
MTFFRSALLVTSALLLTGSLRAITPGLQTPITVQGVITFTAAQTPKVVSSSTGVVDYKATQNTVRLATTDLIGMFLNSSDPAEIKQWTLVGVRSASTTNAVFNYAFYLVNANKAITPVAVSSSVFSTTIYSVANTYTERWQGVSYAAVPVSGSGSFKLFAGFNLALADGNYSIATAPVGVATGTYKVAPLTYGTQRIVTYVPGAIKMTAAGTVTISDGSSTVYAVGEFTFSTGANVAVDLDKFPAAQSGGSAPASSSQSGSSLYDVAPSS